MLIRRRGDARRTAQSEPSLERKRSDGLRLGCLRQLQCGTTVLPSNGACSFDPKDPTRPPLAFGSTLPALRVADSWLAESRKTRERIPVPTCPFGSITQSTIRRLG